MPAPAAGARDRALRVAAPCDRAGAADEREPDPQRRARHEGDPRVVGHDDAILETDPAEDVAQNRVVLGPIRPGDAESQSLRADPGFSLRLFDDRVKNLLDLELSVRAQVRSAPRGLLR